MSACTNVLLEIWFFSFVWEETEIGVGFHKGEGGGGGRLKSAGICGEVNRLNL